MEQANKCRCSTHKLRQQIDSCVRFKTRLSRLVRCVLVRETLLQLRLPPLLRLLLGRQRLQHSKPYCFERDCSRHVMSVVSVRCHGGAATSC